MYLQVILLSWRAVQTAIRTETQQGSESAMEKLQIAERKKSFADLSCASRGGRPGFCLGSLLHFYLFAKILCRSRSASPDVFLAKLISCLPHLTLAKAVTRKYSALVEITEFFFPPVDNLKCYPYTRQVVWDATLLDREAVAL